jgi:hypothetical protein
MAAPVRAWMIGLRRFQRFLLVIFLVMRDSRQDKTPMTSKPKGKETLLKRQLDCSLHPRRAVSDLVAFTKTRWAGLHLSDVN